MIQDLRYAARMLATQPAFTLVVVVTLALGIGGATTMFGIVDGVLIKPLPYPDANRLIRIGRVFGGIQTSSTSAVDFGTLGTSARTLMGVAIARSEAADVSGASSPERLTTATVSASYFSVLGISPSMGRLFEAPDDRSGARQAVVISDSLWRRQLSRDPAAVGRTLTVNGQPHTVIGILPPDFEGPEALGQLDVHLWLPLGRLQLSTDPDDASFETIARLTTGTDVAAATRELAGLPGSSRFWLAPLRDQTVGDLSSSLWLLFGGVSLLMILACSNVANLFLIRATGRAREIAIRAALGAGRGRIARQLLTETICFAFAGGIGGALLAYAGIGLVRRWAPSDLPRVADLDVDLRVLAFAFLWAAGSGIAFGLLPARLAQRTNFAAVLQGTSLSLTAGLSVLRQRGFLVVIQTAIATALVVGAALLAHSLLRLSSIPPGFDPTNVAWMDVSLPDRTYAGGSPKVVFFEETIRQLRTQPGIASVSVIQGRPLGGGNAVATVAPQGRLPADGEQPPRVPFHVVAPGYFDTIGIPRLDGRDFSVSDVVSSPRVAIVSRSFADRFWKGERAVGKRIWVGRIAADAPPVEIVGVVEDVRQYSLAEAPVPMMYRPFAQMPRGNATILVRHDGRSATAALDRIRSSVVALDSAIPTDRAGTMDGAVWRSIREPRFRTLALSLFGVMACAIACVGLYGALAWLVRARSREMAVRLALGARPSQLRGHILGRGMALALLGVTIGLALAAAGSGLLSSMVFGITSTDVATFAIAGLTMFVVALAATWLPATRAGRIEPVEVLRD